MVDSLWSQRRCLVQSLRHNTPRCLRNSKRICAQTKGEHSRTRKKWWSIITAEPFLKPFPSIMTQCVSNGRKSPLTRSKLLNT
ncbi:hypothetical protein EMPG_11403 [Blastomyces silverae]|uniref:Uncharacterized protein n=1 Tax=Blastomyces silverae TaxID=2060906 RepID=A0A0H1BRD3_9EURO|nr:hypothetical protein EMPG_11403 [Blastomyces silverae]